MKYLTSIFFLILYSNICFAETSWDYIGSDKGSLDKHFVCKMEGNETNIEEFGFRKINNRLFVFSYFPEEKEKPEGEVVRDYYIFDKVPFDNEAIKDVIIGRKYDEPNSSAREEFCYINVWQEDGIGQRLNLILIDEDGRTEIPFDQSMAQKLDISLNELHKAREACTI